MITNGYENDTIFRRISVVGMRGIGNITFNKLLFNAKAFHQNAIAESIDFSGNGEKGSREQQLELVSSHGHHHQSFPSKCFLHHTFIL
ncbi:hypothetical protein ACJIZ3_021718 [Penstemon smallii]|uniref:Uncharacterized protein n=1 Tax=Penstemon smallii TaxID=265156 RepID=A0ABD3SMB2_9LAMI